MIAALAAEAAGTADAGLAALSFTAVLSLAREHVAADTCCRHCGQRPTSGGGPARPAHLRHRAQPSNLPKADTSPRT